MKTTWFQVSLVSILGCAVVGSTLALRRPDYSFFDPIVDIKKAVSELYVDEPDEKAMQAGAINGMLGALNDPYTIYVPAAQTREFTKELTGDFVGIGVSILVRDGWLTVMNLLEDTPAFRAGILPEDRIIEVDGKPTFGLTGDQCVEMLTGEPGTDVKIVIERGDRKIPMTITRQRIIARTVKGVHWDRGAAAPAGGGAPAPAEWNYFIDPARRVAYIRLTQFSPTSAEEITRALESIGAREGKLGGLVLDLRWNGGGVLDDAIEIADLFLKEGTIVSTRGRARPEEVTRATADGTLPDFPLVLLVNGQSASASEVLTGALVENHRAIAVGTRTFGKGLVQGVIGLQSAGGGQLKITEQRYYLPSGRCIQRTDDSKEWGVDPSEGFYVPLSDEQLVDLAAVRRTEETIGGARPGGPGQDWADPSWIIEHLKDPQLAAAVKAVQVRIDTGKWEPTGQKVDQARAISMEELRRMEGVHERMIRELARLETRIESMEEGTGPDTTNPEDFWPDATDLTDGSLIVKDKAGNVVATLKITGNNLERWLLDADVKKLEEKK
ncbi:MAG: S41 family peptidase [Phycisphaerales bacterium]|nr:S41 family peptidase [Phycisphaerales bacterium]